MAPNMANLLVVDSSYYIGRSRLGLDPFADLYLAAEFWESATCGMIVMEVLRGCLSEKIRKRYEAAFSCMVYLPTSNKTWERAASLAWTLDRQGKTIPATDLVIAASALSDDAAILTHDAHFDEVPDLRVLRSLL